jgi:hypothetical protein
MLKTEMKLYNGVTVDYKVAADSGVLETWLLIVKENTST